MWRGGRRLRGVHAEELLSVAVEKEISTSVTKIISLVRCIAGR
jgi:hypothetical protein